MNIVLIGYRCCGKTSVGRILAGRLGWEFLDTDRLIEERAAMPIERMVSTRGWKDFRRVEREVVREISNRDRCVVATGGGEVLLEENVRDLKKNGRIFWLDAAPGVIRTRMEKDLAAGRERPALGGAGPVDEIRQVLDQRRPLYARAGDFVVDTGALSPEGVAGWILDRMDPPDE